MKNRYDIDMLNGPLTKKLIVFSLPLMLSSVLQLLFNAADIIVVGQFAGNNALAAVGSTGALINLLVNLFIGLSIGVSVEFGKYVGANDLKNARETLHTGISFAFIGGFIMIFVGYFFSGSLLEMMMTPEDVLALSTLYMRIFFTGMPAFMIYNFGAALLRAVGDTKRPLYYLSIAGVINVVLNLIFVLVFKMSVEGVAIATVISQYISALLIILCLKNSDGYLRLSFDELKIHKDKASDIIKIGLPAGIQGMVFSISNVIIQSGINSFGKIVVAGNTAASNIEGFVYVCMNSIYQTALSFTSQNYGAKKYKRIYNIFLQCIILVTVIGVLLGGGAYIFGSGLLSLYTNDPEVIKVGLQRMAVICMWYFICGIMDTIVGVLRGVGYSIIPMIISLTGACLFRIVWILTIFQADMTLNVLLLSYPISWIITAFMHFITFVVAGKRKLKETLT